MDFIFNGVKHLLVSLSGLSLLLLPINKHAHITPSPSPIVSKAIYKQITKPNNVIISGSYTYLNQDLRYFVTFPKDGGEVQGTVQGLCDGSTNGKFDGREGGNVEGTASADCGVAFIKHRIQIHYSGTVYPSKGQMMINWDGDIPGYANKGSFTFGFTPVH